MESRSFGAHVSPTERTVPNDPEQTLAAPRFDEKSVQGARPAVPLTLRAKARTWPLAVVFTCILAGLAGGLLGGVALMKYRGDRADSEPPNAPQRQTPAAPEARPAGATDSQPDGTQATADPQAAANQPAADSQQSATDQPDGSQAPSGATEPAANDESVADSQGVGAEAGEGAELRASLDGWLAATNARDVGGQMKFYAPTVEAFYLSRNASRESVRAEKSRLFSQARAVDVRASDPEIRVSRDGRTAVMRFRKRYRIDERGGEVLQELRWRRTGAGWRIVAERDLRVIR
jgi:ketosteroid isomerase-like protein